MALDNVLKIYDEQGNPVNYDILASDVKFLPDGKDLPTKLAEIEAEIGEGGGYTPPQGGIPKTDLAPGVQISLGLADTALQADDKTQLQAAINAVQTALNNLMNGASVTDAIDTFNEVVDFLNDIDTDDPTLFNQLKSLSDAITALQTALAGKISGIKANGASDTLPVDSNGIVTLPPAGSTISPADTAPQMDGTANVGSSAKYAREDHVHPHDSTKLSKSDVSVETQGDGTVDIIVGSGANKDTYTINLNHTHEDMAKLVVDMAANLPDVSEMESDTIYGEVEDGEIAVLYVGGVPFYGGGGQPGTPRLISPREGVTYDIGNFRDQLNPVSNPLRIKGKNLTANSTLSVTIDDGTNIEFGTTQPSGVTRNSATSLSITADAAMSGVDIVLVCTSTNINIEDTLTVVSSANSINTECTLIANILSIPYAAPENLVFWLDGEDAESGQWVDRVGLIPFTLHGTTRNQDGGVVFNGTSDYGKYANVLGFSAASCTIEAVISNGVSATTVVFMQNADDMVILGLGAKDSSQQIPPTMSMTSGPNTQLQIGSEALVAGLKVISMNTSRAYVNKTSYNLQTSGYFGKRDEVGTFIGGRTSSQSLFSGTIYQIRIYNTILTEDQILANQEIDRIKYNIS